MIPDDNEPPVHRVSRVDDRQRLLSETLAHVEAQEAHYRLPMEPERRQPLWKTGMAFALFLLAGCFAIHPPAVLRGPRPPAPTVAEQEQGVRAVLYLQAEQVEAFRIAKGRLPASLSEVEVRMPGVEYVRSNSRTYQLVARRPGGGTIVYDSAVPSPDFADVAASWGIGKRAP